MAEEDSKKTGLDWMELSKVVAMPLATLLIGYYLNESLNKRQMTDNNVHLYADMMGRREEADSTMRKDMFNSILGTFLNKESHQVLAEHLEQEVLNIELLAYNFDESLDLSPLFKHVHRDVTDEKNHPDQNLLWRIERVALDVKERQLATLADSGSVARGDINLGTQAWTFGDSTVQLKPGEKRGGPTLCMSINSTDGEQHFRQFKIEFLDFQKDRREMELDLSISKPISEIDCKRILPPTMESANVEADAQFWVGLFAFPMIDNTRLSHSERCSISVTGIYTDSIDVAVAFFQASRASLKDKLYYDEVLHDLLHTPTLSKAPEH